MIDAGAWATALVDSSAIGDSCRQILGDDPDWAAPSHAPIETLRTIRRFETAGLITTKQADVHAAAVREAEIRHADPGPWLLAWIWEHRQKLSPYDAPYVALAQHYDVSLVTLDKQLARAAIALDVRVQVPRE